VSASTALALPALSLPVRYGSRAQIACAHGDVWAAISCVGLDRQTNVATYAMRIANNSAAPLRACLRIAGGRAGRVSDVAIAAFSIFETLVPLRMSALQAGGACVEVSGSGIAFSIDVPAAIAPERRERTLAYRIAAVSSALLLGLGIAAIAWLARPARALPAVHRHVAAHVAVKPPKQRAAHATAGYVPLLDDVSVSPLPAHAGGVLRVTYATAATAGDVWLLDLQGRVWAHTGIAPSGTTWLRVPRAAAGREMRVVVHALHGVEHAQTGVGIIVLPDAADVAAASEVAPAGPSVAVASRAVSGGTIRIALPARHGEALVSLTDGSGAVLSEVDVPAETHAPVSLTAPTVSAATTYDVVVTLSHGYSQQELVRPVTVAP